MIDQFVVCGFLTRVEQIQLGPRDFGHFALRQQYMLCRDGESEQMDSVMRRLRTHLSWFSSCERSVFIGLITGMVRTGGMLCICVVLRKVAYRN
jgi:hypothetical protein